MRDCKHPDLKCNYCQETLSGFHFAHSSPDDMNIRRLAEDVERLTKELSEARMCADGEREQLQCANKRADELRDKANAFRRELAEARREIERLKFEYLHKGGFDDPSQL